MHDERKKAPILYFARCGWCGAYEGTVDPGEACAQDPDTGEFIGPHQFGVYERVETPEGSGVEAEPDHLPF